MPELMDQATFRTALETAIKGNTANKSPFSIAWAGGKLSRAHLARAGAPGPEFGTWESTNPCTEAARSHQYSTSTTETG